jgi:hypothetical protein
MSHHGTVITIPPMHAPERQPDPALRVARHYRLPPHALGAHTEALLREWLALHAADGAL